MKNWSRHLEWHPAVIEYPQSEDEVIKVVQRAITDRKTIRIIGSGHSFMPLSSTNQVLVSLDQYQGILAIDKEKNWVTVKAGTKLNYLNELLAKEGLALENMGDIDVQSIAGATGTGTHGTGTAFVNLSTQIRQIKFVNGLGELVTCSENTLPEVFKAAQISLGTLGIITELTLQCVPAYTLALEIGKDTLEHLLEQYEAINATNRNFEFYWFPNTPYVMTKKSNITNAPPDRSSFKDYLQEILLENYAFLAICEASYRFPSLTHRLSRFAASTIDNHKKINESHKVFSTTRMVRFNEMEYNIPVVAYKEVKKELTNWINKNNYEVLFPIENRFVKGDDIYLSPAYQRDSAYIAVHVYHKKDFKKYFSNLEAIFRAHEGRPHWGKINSLKAADVAKLYPKFEAFDTIRATHDPHQLFLSPYLKSLFSPESLPANTHEQISLL